MSMLRYNVKFNYCSRIQRYSVFKRIGVHPVSACYENMGNVFILGTVYLHMACDIGLKCAGHFSIHSGTQIGKMSCKLFLTEFSNRRSPDWIGSLTLEFNSSPYLE